MKNLLSAIVVALGCVLCIGFILNPQPARLNNQEDLLDIPITETTQIPGPFLGPERKPRVPVILSIERLGINAPIESVGVSLDGAMAVPDNVFNVGWYDLGTIPGEPGSAVLAGHVNGRGGTDAVFTRLKEILPGDSITVTDNYGNMDTFTVMGTKRFPQYGSTAEVFESLDDRSHLKLITCDGAWNKIFKTHDSRLVVYADKIIPM